MGGLKCPPIFILSTLKSPTIKNISLSCIPKPLGTDY